MTLPSIDTGLAGGAMRVLEGLASAAPTFLVGLLIAAVLRYYFGDGGIRALFGGQTWRSLPQSWAIGMLLPVCSIGVLPILMVMRRARVKPGSLSAFALSAPLFNPLSLLYGLTLSRPMIVVMFALGSLLVVTLVGLIWDGWNARREHQADASSSLKTEGRETDGEGGVIGVRRLLLMLIQSTRSLAGPAGFWGLLALSGLLLLSMVLPFGAMQYSVERDDWFAPATMLLVSVPAYATPMLAMSQLGMMFQHANSPGAAFVLLVMGTGVNLATLLWLARHFGARGVGTWFLSLVLIVMGLAYAVNRPLIPHGVEPAGHTHAFDVYTNPLRSLNEVSWIQIKQHVLEEIDFSERISLIALTTLVCVGAASRLFGIDEQTLELKWGSQASGKTAAEMTTGFDRVVSSQLVGGVMICGLIAISVVMCYGYYPSPQECLKEIAAARAECLAAANSGQVEHSAHWLEIWDDWSRRLEVGTFLRTGNLRPYQRMQGYLIRKKLELLEHELEHEPFDQPETSALVRDILRTNIRWVDAFRESSK